MNAAGSLIVAYLKKDFYQGGVQQQVLAGINAEFEQGKAYAITGVSGSGKSTFLHLLGGLDQPTSGTVLFNGQDIFKLPRKDAFLNKSIGFVFQFHYLIKELTVLENVMLMGLIKGENRKKCLDRAQSLLSAIGLADKINHHPGQLSGGEQQRVSIARAIFNKPSFLLADEPTGNLDEANAELIVSFFLQASNEWKMGLVICSHDKAVYKKMETVYCLHNGLLSPINSF